MVGIELIGFKIVEMTEVYHVDLDGRKDGTRGFFKDKDIAVAFTEYQIDSSFYKTDKAFVLTNGVVGYVVGQQESVELFDDESEALKLREKVIAKLSPADRLILGIES